jgi:hypothetical protein
MGLCNQRDTRSKHCTQAQPMTWVLTVQLVRLNQGKELDISFADGHFKFPLAVLFQLQHI